LRTVTTGRTIAFAGIAFVIGIRIRSDGSTNAIVSAAFFRRRASLTSPHADVAATIAIDAIVRQALGRRRARDAIVILAHVFPVARAIRAVVVGIGIVSNRAANAVNTAAFFGGATRHAFVVAFVIAAKAVDTISGRTLIVGGTSLCI